MKMRAKQVIVEEQEVVTKKHYAVSVVIHVGIVHDFLSSGVHHHEAERLLQAVLRDALNNEDSSQAEVIRV